MPHVTPSLLLEIDPTRSGYVHRSAFLNWYDERYAEEEYVDDHGYLEASPWDAPPGDRATSNRLPSSDEWWEQERRAKASMMETPLTVNGSAGSGSGSGGSDGRDIGLGKENGSGQQGHRVEVALEYSPSPPHVAFKVPPVCHAPHECATSSHSWAVCRMPCVLVFVRVPD